MFVRLEWQDPETGEVRQQAATLPATLGRDQSNTVQLPYGGVSRLHARLELRGGILVISDMGSRNGVLINGQRLQEASLTTTEHTVQLGAVTIKLTPVNEAIGAAPPAFSADVWRNARQFYVEYIDPTTGAKQRYLARLPISLGRTTGMSITLNDPRVSRAHATIDRRDGQIVVVDEMSDSGTYLNGHACPPKQPVPFRPGSVVQIVEFQLSIFPDQDSINLPHEQLVRALAVDASDTSIGIQRQSFPPPLFDRESVDIVELKRLGIPVEEVDYLTIGGGLGSFIWADHLVIFGVKPHQIRSIGFGKPEPYERYQDLCRKSQIPSHERLRSNSDSCPDNIWGWPGYAVREAYHSLAEGDINNAAWVLWQIFGEPTLVETYTPKSGNVFASIDREADRIDWNGIWREGRVRKIRKTTDGRYVAAYSTRAGNPNHRFVIGRHLHISVGYPAFRLVDDLQTYREQTGDNRTVVNAYEDHEHVYDQLRRNGGGTVVVRGRGIVSSRIVQTLYELREEGVRVQVINMGRSLLTDATGEYNGVKRDIKNNWEFQPFNWPKANWSGDLRELMENVSPEERKQLLRQWGGTTTADRTDWQRIVTDGLEEGWYAFAAGTARGIQKNASGRLIIALDPNKQHVICTGPSGQQQRQIDHIEADFIVDGTGLISGIDRHPLLHDLTSHYRLPPNVQGRLHVENDFEIPGLRNDPGRAYACGVSTLGGPYAPVDSFLGLQYACLRSVDSLVRVGAPDVQRLNFFGSLNQWIRWVRGVQP